MESQITYYLRHPALIRAELTRGDRRIGKEHGGLELHRIGLHEERNPPVNAQFSLAFRALFMRAVILLVPW
jgi:hypothetical protein